MICQHWRQEDSFCTEKEETVNPDEVSDCAETCPDYEPSGECEIVTCSTCGTEFPLKKTNKIEVNNREYPRCPACGTVVGLKRDDEKLNKSSK
jgi:DNA-directed RNA polymerase subunit RPC12/RpoP